MLYGWNHAHRFGSFSSNSSGSPSIDARMSSSSNLTSLLTSDAESKEELVAALRSGTSSPIEISRHSVRSSLCPQSLINSVAAAAGRVFSREDRGEHFSDGDRGKVPVFSDSEQEGVFVMSPLISASTRTSNRIERNRERVWKCEQCERTFKNELNSRAHFFCW